VYDGPAYSIVLKPEASGVLVKSNDRAVIDYSNTVDGYVMVQFVGTTTTRLKVQVIGPSGTTYTYNIKVGQWEVLPLSDGEGTYRVRILENVTDNRYSTVLSLSTAVTLEDAFAPFIRPNQYVNYENATQTVSKSAELCRGKTDVLDKVKVVYDYVVNTLSYDYDLAATVESGYLPDLDAVLAEKKGICFDYAALMTAMLRCQGIPRKLVVGYAGTGYHAWISVWSEETGWIDGAVYFDGISWKRMDPTFASTSGGSQSVKDFIANDANYTTKYLY
jgi:transglutaminase-like putative cysteine protease